MEVFESLGQRRRYWGRVVSAWQKSGLTQAEFCRQKVISPKSISYWVRQARKGKRAGLLLSAGEGGTGGQSDLPAVQFVAIPPALVTEPQNLGRPGATPPKNSSGGKLVLRIGKNFRVTIPADFSPEALATVVRILEGQP